MNLTVRNQRKQQAKHIALVAIIIVLASCAPVSKDIREIPDWKQAVYYQDCESRPEEGYEPTGIMEIDPCRERIAHYYNTTWDLLFIYVEKIDNCPAYYTFEQMSINKTAEEKEQIFRNLPPEDRQAILTFREKNAEIYDKMSQEAIRLLSEVTNTGHFFNERRNCRNLLNRGHNINDPAQIIKKIIKAVDYRNHQRCALSKKQLEYTIKALQWIKIEHEIMSNFASQ
ncbi:MAG: hypothetical protein LWX01_07530 [Deltaproteobacteria bacterium]|nr:hypothetical protein [Deltaproteobacteria bacterium]MDL1961535.1 hypothetical protein [Deltaproteobacteria bacterium]